MLITILGYIQYILKDKSIDQQNRICDFLEKYSSFEVCLNIGNWDRINSNLDQAITDNIINQEDKTLILDTFNSDLGG